MHMKKVNCILLVDDNPADNYYHKYIITDAAICNRIEAVFSGDEALAYLIKSGEPGQEEAFPKPDIIFLDINMPRMNGFEFLEEFVKLDEELKSKLVVIMLTTSLNPEDRNRAMKIEEVKEFQNKPLSVEVLEEILERHF
jgi:CheY-like chemotaxis protein